MKQELFKKTDKFFKNTRLWVAAVIAAVNIFSIWFIIFYARYYMSLNMQRAIVAAETEAKEVVREGFSDAKIILSFPGFISAIKSADYAELSSLFDSILESSDTFSFVFLSELDGRIIFTSDDAYHKAALWREPYFSYLSSHNKGELFSYGVYFSPVFFEPAYVYAFILPDSARALVFYLDMSKLRERTLGEYNSAFNVDILFTDMLGYSFAGQDYDADSGGFEKYLISKTGDLSSYRDKKGRSWFFSFKWMDDFSSFVITRVKKDDFKAMLWPLIALMWLFSVIMFFAYSLWNNKIYHNIVFPLRRLVRTSTTLGMGNIVLKYEDEVSFIEAAVRKSVIDKAGNIAFPVPLVFIVMDESGRVLKRGGQLASYFINLEEGDYFSSLISEPSVFEKDIFSLKSGQKQVFVSYSVLSEDDRRQVEGVMVTLPESNNLLMLLTVSRDFVSDELNKMYLLETMGNVLGSVSDAFSNILTGIKGNLDMFLRDKSLSSDDKRRFESILFDIARAGRISRQLLAFSNGMSFKPKKVVLSSVFSSAFSSFPEDKKKRVDIVSDPSVEALVDTDLFSHALCNVLDFIFARLSSSRIEIRVFMSGQRPVYGAPEGAYICISIFARSLFISEDEVKWIFRPYEKGDFPIELLGMPVAYQILKRHKGYMLFNSHLDGTSIDIFIPEIQ